MRQDYRLLSEDEAREALRRTVNDFGTQKAFAEFHQLSEQYVSDVLLGKRNISKKIASLAGFERVTGFRKK